MNYGAIKNNDVANGEGIRVTLFVSGCRNHCEGCFQPETWDFNYGRPYTEEVEDKIIEYMNSDHIAGLTCLGGEPFEEENQPVIMNLFKRVKKLYPNKNIWCFTGYTLEKDLLDKDGAKHTEFTNEMLSYIDILVDGRFKIEEKDLTLKFRGSRNQRILDLNKLRQKE